MVGPISPTPCSVLSIIHLSDLEVIYLYIYKRSLNIVLSKSTKIFFLIHLYIILSNITMRLLVVFIATIIQCLVYSSALLQSFDHAPKQDGSLSFLVIGDWGRRGSYNQSQVAFQVMYMGYRLIW
jgi:hypothetical protein